jgi:cbb3-type cytochrome oxidase maturation protein
MSSLLVTIPWSLLLAGALLWIVVRAVRAGAFDDWDGPAMRLLQDDDRTPELESAGEPLAVRDLPGSDEPIH